MKGILVQTTLYPKDLRKIVRTKKLGKKEGAIGKQLPMFEERPLSYCSFFCEGYKDVYGNREGVAFETEASPVYALPCDSFHLMRSGRSIPGYEKFVFKSIEEMLEKYPSYADFQKDFKEFFEGLTPQEVYPDSWNSPSFVRMQYETDYCLNPSEGSRSFNEITFDKPIKIKNVQIFNSTEDLEKELELQGEN